MRVKFLHSMGNIVVFVLTFTLFVGIAAIVDTMMKQ